MFLPRPTALLTCTALAWCLCGSVTAQAPGSPAPSASATFKGVPASAPTWAELTPAQRTALSPLARNWDQISEGQRRKWIVMAQNFGRLPPAEQAKMHGRMAEWVALSPNDRTQARLNFGEAKQLPPDERKAKWEAYQALSPEEKRKLAAGAAAKTPSTAAAIRPVPPQKLATVPKPTADDAGKTPRIVVAPPGEASSGSRPGHAP